MLITGFEEWKKSLPWMDEEEDGWNDFDDTLYQDEATMQDYCEAVYGDLIMLLEWQGFVVGGLPDMEFSPYCDLVDKHFDFRLGVRTRGLSWAENGECNG